MTLEELEGRIINADCMDILRELPDKCVDLVLTDPPYGINIAERFAKRGQSDKKKNREVRNGANGGRQTGTNQSRRAPFLMRFSEFQKIKLFSAEIILQNTCQIRHAGSFGIR